MRHDHNVRRAQSVGDAARLVDLRGNRSVVVDAPRGGNHDHPSPGAVRVRAEDARSGVGECWGQCVENRLQGLAIHGVDHYCGLPPFITGHEISVTRSTDGRRQDDLRSGDSTSLAAMEASDGPTREQAAAALLGGVLDAFYAGDLTADGASGKALVQRLEGALMALRALEEQRLSR